jgi:small-conductance mechanosensitive channel
MVRFSIRPMIALLVAGGLLAGGGPSPGPGLRGFVPAAARAQAAPTTAIATPSGTTGVAAPSDSLPAPDTTAIARAAAALAVQARSASPETAGIEPRVVVPVFLGGKEIFRVRAGRDGLGPTERAAAIRARLTAAVARRDLPADSVRLIPTSAGIEVDLGHQFLWLITPADIEQTEPDAVATEMARLPAQVRDGILKERAGRRPLGILLAVLAAIALTLAAGALLRLLLALDRRWRSRFAALAGRRLRPIRVRGFEVVSQGQLAGVVGGVLGSAHLVLGALLLYAYITAVLSLFPWTQGWSWQLLHLATQGLVEAGRTVITSVPGLLTIAVIVIAFRWLVRLSDRFFEAIAAGALTLGGFHPELANPSKRIARILLWVAAVMVAYPFIPGSHSKAVQGVSLLLGVMVSLGSTGFVGNVISGIVLTYARSFRVGDRVRIADHVGDVTSLGFFATKIRTIRNEELTLPNGLVASHAIVNYTRLAAEHGLILHTQVTIGYNVEWRKVHALLAEAAGRVEGIEREPAPWVFQRSLNDYHVSYELNCVTHQSHPQLRLYSELHQEIQDAFARAGIEILSPGYQALRDGNAPALPEQPAGPRDEPAAFRVRADRLSEGDRGPHTGPAAAADR